MAKMTNRTKKTAISLAISTVSVAALVYDSMDAKASIYSTNNLLNQESEDSVAKKYIFLSDLEYDQKMSYAGWSTIKKDTNINDGIITLNAEGETIEFEKGLGAHATSALVFDVSEYSTQFTRFTTYAGVDKSQGGSGNGVKFTISVSMDGQNWTELATTDVLKGNQEAVFIDVDITGVKYLKLYADDNGNNGNDHAVYGSPRITTADFDPSTEVIGGFRTVAQYDEEIKSKYSVNQQITDEIKHLLLQRTFTQRVGFYTLQKIANTGDEYLETIQWLLTNHNILELYVLGGELENGATYTNSLNVLTQLYTQYKDDFSDAQNGELYLKMAISLSLSHAKSVCFWTGNGPASDASERYRIYKENYNNGRLAEGWDQELFKQLPVELMRWVMDAQLDDEQINWLIDYSLNVKAQNGNFLDAYTYINYTFDYNYNDPKFYNQDNYEMWNDKYNISALTGYGEVGVHKLWMVFEDGSVCGGLAKTYANLGEVFGKPAAVIGQPGHGATLAYRVNEDGLGLWGIQNDISGFPESEKGERFPLGWGSQSWKSYYNVSYILLGQHALNNFETFVEAAYYNFLADVYANDSEKQIEIYNQALAIQNYNLDSLEGLIQAYKTLSNKNSADYLELAYRVADALTYFPLPFFDVMALIEPMITDDTDKVVFDMLRVKTLKEATLATSAESLQPVDCAAVARKLLGENQVELATFSFDGENAGKIMIDEAYAQSSIRWEYSLDNWKTKVQTDEKQLQLTPEELEKINEDDDIQISLVGTSEIYVIDITQHETPTNLYANDLENQFRGLIAPLEYSEDNGATWHDYDELNTRLTGDVTVQVRYKASGTALSSEVAEYIFTEDNQPETRKYIPLENVSLYMYSSQENNTAAAAANFIDGNLNTGWHNTWAGEELKYFSVELDQVRKLSAIEYQNQSGNGNAKDLDIYTSVDGVNWVKVGEARNLANDATLKVIELEKLLPAKYVMLHAVSTHGNPSNVFFTGRLLNLFEDTSMFSFSFDGENAGKIILDDAYTDLDIRWEYSLDGGQTKVETDAKQVILTKEELEKINENDGIQISIVGSSKTQVININKHEAPTDLYANDLENQFRGMVRPLEYSEDGGKTWSLYDPENTRFTSDRTIQVRYQASGTKQHSEAVTYQFTEDNQSETRIYIPVKNLSVYRYSSQETSQGQIAQNFIDGNINTKWHNTWAGEELKYFSVELDQLRYLSAIEYQSQSGNGNAKDLDIYTSIDGVNWEKVGEARNLPNDDTLKVIELENVIPAKYVMVHAVSTYGSRGDVFFTGKMLNLFEDTTKEQNIEVTVTYNIETLTNQDVTATINLPEGYTVLGDTSYTFIENGTHTFTYYSPTGKEYTHTITVDWIDKEVPSATISYSNENKTNQNVVATLVLPEDENIQILNNNGQATYEFTENGCFTFEIQDEAGNISYIEATVSWINKEIPVLDVVYSTLEETYQPVVATLITDNVTIKSIDGKVITVTNNNGQTEYIFIENGEFTFEYIDDYGNVGTTTAKVDWIIESDVILPDEENPGDSDDSENPDDSDDSDDSEEPGDSEDSDDSENPGDSDDSDDSENPDDSDDSENPDDSDDSENPDDSEDSENPGDSDDSDDSEEPGDSEDSDDSDDSDDSENPDDSDDSENSEDSDDSENPDDSDDSENPDDSDDSENPDDSEDSDDSENPGDSDDSDDSENPDDSDDSDDSEEPGDSDDSDDSENPDDSDDSDDSENPDDSDDSEEPDEEQPELPEEDPVTPEQPGQTEIPEYIQDIIDSSVVRVVSGEGTEEAPLQLEIKDVMSNQLDNFINNLETSNYQLVAINENDDFMIYYIKISNSEILCSTEEAYVVIKVNKSLKDYDNINQKLIYLFNIEEQPELPEQEVGVNLETPVQTETTEHNKPVTGYTQTLPLLGGALSTLIGMLTLRKRKR